MVNMSRPGRMSATQSKVANGIDKALVRMTPPIIFFRKASFKGQVSLWPKDRLFSVLELLYKCERDCKTTNMPVVELVSFTLMQIASAAAKLSRRGY